MEPESPAGSTAPAAADEILDEPTQATAAADRLESLARFDRWVRLLFLALAALGFGLGVMAAADEVAGTSGAVGVATIFIGSGVLVGVGWALAAGRTWARPAAVLLCWVLIALGVLRFALLLAGAGSLQVPFEAVLAAFALSLLPAGERRDIGRGTDGSWAVVYAATYVAVSLLPLILG